MSEIHNQREMEHLQSEVARLEHEKRSAALDWMVAAGQYEDEIARLRAALEEARADLSTSLKIDHQKDAAYDKLRAALEPFAEMGRVMMGRRHHMEAVIQYGLARTVKVHHLIAAHEARAALGGAND